MSGQFRGPGGRSRGEERRGEEEGKGGDESKNKHIDPHISHMLCINRVQTWVDNAEHYTIHQRLTQDRIKPAVKVMIMEA